jgi:hypothetical protein
VKEIMMNARCTEHLGKMTCENDCMRYNWGTPRVVRFE